MRNIKPYPLEWKILQILSQFGSADVFGIGGAVSKYYSIHTVRKELKRMENRELVYSVRDFNKNKIYSLTAKGTSKIQENNINYSGLSQFEYNDIVLKWSNFLGGKTNTNNLPTGISAINIDSTGNFSALVIEKENQSLNEFLKSLEAVLIGDIPFAKVYIVLFNNYRKQAILEAFDGGVEIEFFKID